MPLRIKIPARDKLMINGAIVENGAVSTTLIFHNRCDILRRKEIMQESEADTPARLVYYTLQCAYMFEDARGRFLELCGNFIDEYLQAAPSAVAITSEIQGLIKEGRLYNALKKANNLIAHEAERLGLADLR